MELGDWVQVIGCGLLVAASVGAVHGAGDKVGAGVSGG